MWYQFLVCAWSVGMEYLESVWLARILYLAPAWPTRM